MNCSSKFRKSQKLKITKTFKENCCKISGHYTGVCAPTQYCIFFWKNSYFCSKIGIFTMQLQLSHIFFYPNRRSPVRHVDFKLAFIKFMQIYSYANSQKQFHNFSFIFSIHFHFSTSGVKLLARSFADFNKFWKKSKKRFWLR